MQCSRTVWTTKESYKPCGQTGKALGSTEEIAEFSGVCSSPGQCAQDWSRESGSGLHGEVASVPFPLASSPLCGHFHHLVLISSGTSGVYHPLLPFPAPCGHFSPWLSLSLLSGLFVFYSERFGIIGRHRQARPTLLLQPAGTLS